VPNERPEPEWFFIPALALLGLIIGLQWRRNSRLKSAPATVASA